MNANDDTGRPGCGEPTAWDGEWGDSPYPAYGEPAAETAPGGWPAPDGEADQPGQAGAGGAAACPGDEAGRADAEGAATAGGAAATGSGPSTGIRVAAIAAAVAIGAAVGFGGAWFVRGQEIGDLRDRSDSLEEELAKASGELDSAQGHVVEAKEAGRTSLTAFDGYDLCGLEGHGNPRVNNWQTNGEASNLGFGCEYEDGVMVTLGWWDSRAVSGQQGDREGALVGEDGYLIVDDRGRREGEFGSMYVWVPGAESDAKRIAEEVRQELEDTRTG